MSVTQVLGGLGSWELELRATTPDDVRSKLGWYGHVAVVDGPVDVAAAGDALLAGARYVGVCRGRGSKGTFSRAGSGLLFWLGDEDDKGHVIENELVLTSMTLAQAVAAVMPPTLTLGTVHPQATPAARYTGTHQFQSPRQALVTICAAFGAEVRVNPNFTVDIGTPAQLYNTEAPDRIIVRRGAGSDIDLVAVPGEVETEEGAYDYSTRVVILGQTIGTGDVPDEVFVKGAQSAPTVPYVDPRGNAVKFTRLISASGETEGSVGANTQLQLNRFNRTTRSVRVTAEDFDTAGTFAVGDAVYVYDPDTGIVNAANQVTFQGQVLHPDVVRVSEDTWPLLEGMTVAWRTDTGVWVDLTPWVLWETRSSGELTVGDLPKSLMKPAGNPVQDRVDAARPSTKIPKAPTGLTLTTTSTINSKGEESAVVTATWLHVTQNTDNTTVALSHYEVQWRPQFRAPLWVASSVTADDDIDLLVPPALVYDVHVRAVSTGGKVSNWSTTESITAAADSQAPGAPADPQLTNILGQIRVRYPGTTSTGAAMPADANRVDVEVGTTAAGPWVVESSLNPFVEGIHYVTAPYATTRWIRLRAYDHNRNVGPASAAVSAATAQLGNADIASVSVAKLIAGTMSADVVNAGRIATALTGARVEMNALGFQKFSASNALLVSITGTEALLTGVYKTALTGRRIEIGAGGKVGELEFIAPDGDTAFVRAFTESVGVEAIQFGLQMAGTNSLWNRINYNSDEWANYRANKQDFYYGSTDGFFVVRETGDFGITNNTKFHINPAGTHHTFATGQRFDVIEQQGAGTVTRLLIDGDEFLVRDELGKTRMWLRGNNFTLWGNDDVARIDFNSANYIRIRPSAGAGGSNMMILPSLTPEESTKLQLADQDNFAVTLKFYRPNGLEVRSATDTGWEDVFCANVFPQSDEALKDNIRDVEKGALQKVLGTRVRRYDMYKDTKKTGGSSDRIGVVAQEAPPEVVHPNGTSIDLYQLVTLDIAALQEFYQEFSEFRAEVRGAA